MPTGTTIYIVKTWNFTKNKLYYSLKLKTKITDFVTVSFTAVHVHCKALIKTDSSTKALIKTDSSTTWSYKETRAQALLQACPLPVLFNRDLAQEFTIPISSFSLSAHEIHFQKEFFEGNSPFIPPNIIISWVRSVSFNTCNW